MFLQDKQSGSLIKIVELENLFNPLSDTVKGKIQQGQNEQPPELLKKTNLSFPSGEDLPICWLDKNYQIKQ